MEITMKYNWPCSPFHHWMKTVNMRGSGYSGDYTSTYCQLCRYAAEFNKDFATLGHTDHPKGCKCGLPAYENKDINKNDRVTEIIDGKIFIIPERKVKL